MNKSSLPIFKNNSLDLIRLLAATQVAILHITETVYPEYSSGLFMDILRLIPGVPVFFFISGYLISKSFERSPSIIEYTQNRALRIYPALIACVFLNLIMVAATGYFGEMSVKFIDILKLFLAKVSFLQFYNPDFMREFGDGVLNGSLWTICVELQFYILTPFLYYVILNRVKNINIALCALILFFLSLNQLLIYLRQGYNAEIWWKLFHVSFLPWFYMFLTGIFFQRNFSSIIHYLNRVHVLFYIVTYFIICYLLSDLGFNFNNHISPLVFTLIVLLTFRLAYSFQGFTNSILRGNDISYGIYIWHMPILNQAIYLTYENIWLVFALTLGAAFLSWKMIEMPTLKLKPVTIKPTT